MATADTALGSNPIQAKRVVSFARFFKNYMSVSAVVVASLPIPVTSLHLIKTYKEQTEMLTVYTSLFCFLILGFIFFSRHGLARTMFSDRLGQKTSTVQHAYRRVVNSLPVLLIAGSLTMVFFYHDLLSTSLVVVKARSVAIAQGGAISAAYLYDMQHSTNRYEVFALANQFLNDRQILAAGIERAYLERRAYAETSAAQTRAASTPTSTASVTTQAESLETLLVSTARQNVESKGELGRVSKDYLNWKGAMPGSPAFWSAVSAYVGSVAPLAENNPETFIGLNSPLEGIPWSMWLMLYYLGIFAFAEAAFVLMALKEYLLDLLRLSDEFLISGSAKGQVQAPEGT